MKYYLVIQPPALDEIENAYLWIKAEAPQSADHWFDGLMAKLETLKEFPERCGLAEENEYFEDEIRQLLYGRRGGVYRILFTDSRQCRLCSSCAPRRAKATRSEFIVLW